MKISKSKIFASGLVAIMLSVFSTSNIKAAEALKIGSAELSFNAGYMSQYIWRGQDQNNNDGSVSAGADLAMGDFYAGIWTAGVDYNGSKQEVDFYAGYTPTLGPIGLDLGYISYKYPGNNSKATNFGEFYAKASFAPEKQPYSLKVSFFSDDQASGSEVGAEYLEYSAGYDFGFASLSVAYGDYKNSRETWTTSVSKEIAGLNFTIAYIDNEEDTAGSLLSKNMTTLSVSKSF